MKIPVGKHFLTIIFSEIKMVFGYKKGAGENFSCPFLKNQG